MCIFEDQLEKIHLSVRKEQLDSIENVILTLFVKSCMTVFQEDVLYLTQIYNTRDNPMIQLESSQALGWYSEKYPLSLKNPMAGNIVGDVKEIVKQKRAIEKKRFSYTLLSHYNDELKQVFDSWAYPGIYFNHQGGLDMRQEKKLDNTTFFDVFNAIANDIDRLNIDFPHWLSCVSRIEDDKNLHIYFIYRTDQLSNKKIKEIIKIFNELCKLYGI